MLVTLSILGNKATLTPPIEGSGCKLYGFASKSQFPSHGFELSIVALNDPLGKLQNVNGERDKRGCRLSEPDIVIGSWQARLMSWQVGFSLVHWRVWVVVIGWKAEPMTGQTRWWSDGCCGPRRRRRRMRRTPCWLTGQKRWCGAERPEFRCWEKGSRVVVCSKLWSLVLSWCDLFGPPNNFPITILPGWHRAIVNVFKGWLEGCW